MWASSCSYSTSNSTVKYSTNQVLIIDSTCPAGSESWLRHCLGLEQQTVLTSNQHFGFRENHVNAKKGDFLFSNFLDF